MSETEPRLITLPGRKEMLKRLTEVLNDPYLIENFFPLILEHSGRDKTSGEGVFNLVIMAIAEHLPHNPDPRTANILLHSKAMDLALALIDDEEAKQDAARFADALAEIWSGR